MKRRLLVLAAAAAILGACADAGTRGPWIDEYGEQLSGAMMVEYDGFNECNHRGVVFIQVFGDKYAKDQSGALGVLESPETGRPITFEIVDAVPDDAITTGFTHAGRELFIGEDRADYIYVRLPNGDVERWPRAEVGCDRE